ncbi:toll-like receptor 4 [Mercenaria mercenaria]|uniref:toll-like receptor 4 n=1 Tax=Mercenaria mercenaria TaxID=6596 RepID=UPI00234F30F4|nr:toll-like receptor 4 [Mercenaria mercenaria]
MDDDLSTFTKNIGLQQNNLKRMDVRLICDTFDLPSVQSFDIADNGMEFVHPKSLSCFRNLRSLDLSKNQLFKMVDENSALFQNLFQGLNYLKVLRMSANGLHNIPNYLFQNSQSIEEIDLSDNTLDQVTFILRDLENLKVLDLQGNNIHLLDPLSIHHLNSISRESNVNISITVILTSNPISCSDCGAKSFLQWLISTYLIKIDSQRLTCLDESSKHNDITGKTVEMVQAICNRKTIKISISVSAAAFFLFSISIVIAIYKRYKHKQRIQNRTNVINNLRDGEGQYQFAVFLSFSNLDEEFVNLHVLNKLNENLQLMTGIDRTLVCTGDQHFRLGFNVHDETFRLLDSASVLIVVVSNHFLTSDFCQSELDKAYEDRKPIVLMLTEQVDPDCMMPTMKALYQNNTRILWKSENGEYVLKTSWENACKSVLDLILCKT